MNDITVTPKPALLAVEQEGNSLLGMIERAARDPSVDIEKMRALLSMRREIVEEDSRNAFDEAMNAAQSEMRQVETNTDNSQTKSKYANYGALDKALRPIYTKHGFSLGFNTAEGAPEAYVRVVCDVSRAGHTRRYQIDMPADGKGAKGGDVMTKTHAVGSAATYGRRYLLAMIFNIATGKDDDGNAAAGSDPITDKQREEIQALIDETGSDIRRFCAAFGIEAVADLPSAKYADAISKLNAKKRSVK